MTTDRRTGRDRRDVDALIVAVLDEQAERRAAERREAARAAVLPARKRSRVPRAAVAVLAAGAGLLGGSTDAAAKRGPCLEDQACWTWPTMGNRRRGVYVKGRTAIVIVGPCRFQRLVRAHRIDWEGTEVIRGDWWATRHGCERS